MKRKGLRGCVNPRTVGGRKISSFRVRLAIVSFEGGGFIRKAKREGTLLRAYNAEVHVAEVDGGNLKGMRLAGTRRAKSRCT